MLMDIRLKGEMDGIEAADIISTSFDIPSLFMTAYSLEEFKRIYKSPPVVEPLQKPIQEEELVHRIQVLLTL
ncbi:MAG: response regulator [Gammaproteobacteria bacterium]|nr:response regulator [Gammaproteobacteria bacterium]